MTRWRKVVYSADCDQYGNCPHCGIDYSECPCPGPTMDNTDYRWRNGVLYARPTQPAETLNGASQSGAA